MKSKLFNTLKDNRIITNDLKTMASFPVNSFKKAVDKYVELERSGKNAETVYFSAIANEGDIPAVSLLRAIGIAGFFIKNEVDNDDKIDWVLEDIKELNIFDEAGMSDIKVKLAYAKSAISPYLNEIINDEEIIEETFPQLDGTLFRVVTIPTFKPKFKPEVGDARSYSPFEDRVVVSVLCQFAIDKYGVNERFAFGLTPSELDSLINSLEAVRKELLAITKDH